MLRRLSTLLAAAAALASANATPLHWEWAPTPPLGWNSWNIFGTTVTERQVKEQADAMARHLLPAGYDILTVDIQWYEPNSQGHTYTQGAPLEMDEYSRLLPAVKKFPSAADGKGFKPLADYVHSKGLKFGIHIMRGIPKQAVHRNTPILGTTARAADIGLTNHMCAWNPDMYGVDLTRPGGQAYYDSLFKLYASWGVDYVKVDDISRPYDEVQKAEIEAIQKAIRNSGRPMVLSLSPGDTPISRGEHVMQHANLWRISDDFWDRWGLLHGMFGRLHRWEKFRAPGAWPDADMLPLGIMDFGRPTSFTRDEQYTLMNLWAIARSPLIFGGDMTRLDAFTIGLLTNPGMLEVNQNSTNNRQISRENNLIAWAADVPGSADRYVALFNAQSQNAEPDFSLADYSSPVISGAGSGVDISLPISGARKLVLFVSDAGDGITNDHVVWVAPTLRGPKGTLNLTDLKWTSATTNWGEVRVNRTTEDQPLLVGGTEVQGIGAHSASRIVYEIPAGYDTFTTRAVLTRAGSVEFGVLSDTGDQAIPERSQVTVPLASIGLAGKVRVRDVWTREDLGVFEGSFGRELPLHGSGLYRLTPVK